MAGGGEGLGLGLGQVEQLVLAMLVEAALPGAVESVAAGLSDGFAAASVLIVGSDVADRLVQPDGIVFRSHSCEFGFEQGLVARWQTAGQDHRRRPTAAATAPTSPPGTCRTACQ